MIDRRYTILKVSVTQQIDGTYLTYVTVRTEVVDYDTGETFGLPLVSDLLADPNSTDPNVQAIVTAAQTLLTAATTKIIPQAQPVSVPLGTTVSTPNIIS